jgi:hypothetical protein
MSYDQKPAKMRVVRGGGAPAPEAQPQRRRGDEKTPVGVPAPVAPASTFPTMLVIGLFIVGCAAGGVALPLLGIV